MPWHERDLSHFRSPTGPDLFDVHEHFAEWLTEAWPAGYGMYAQPATSAPATRIGVEGAPGALINLASYNYLGLSYRPEVIEASVEALRALGLGAAGSPLLSGLLRCHRELEEGLADFKKVEAALLFPTGYSANVGTLSALLGPGDTAITDTLAHASILDGCILAGATLKLFRHNDMNSLERRLREATGRALVVVEGVYSMDGDVAPLPDVVALCQKYGARLMVDEAHSAFLYGEHGRGLAEHFGVEDQIDVHFGTLSKSLGGMGGYVAGSKSLVQYLRTYARSQVFSCAMSPPVAGGLNAALAIARREPELRARLWENVRVMREALEARGVDTGESTSQVIPIFVRDDTAIFAICREMLEAGVYLKPVRYPAVKRHQSRFRVSISAVHDPDELVRAANIVADVLDRRQVEA